MSHSSTRSHFLIASTPAPFLVQDDADNIVRADIVTAFNLDNEFTHFVTVVAGPARAADAVELVRPLAAPDAEFFVRDYHLQDSREWDALTESTGVQAVYGLPPFDDDDDIDPFEDEEDALATAFDCTIFTLDDAHRAVVQAAVEFRDTALTIAAFLNGRNGRSPSND